MRMAVRLLSNRGSGINPNKRGYMQEVSASEIVKIMPSRHKIKYCLMGILLTLEQQGISFLSAEAV